MDVHIIETGLANMASVEAGFSRLGCRIFRTHDPQVVDKADRVVLPGVGQFGAGMVQLRKNGLKGAIRKRIGDQRPTLAICLGLQLLAVESDESPGVEGLGCLPVKVTAFPPTVRSPQFGWNTIRSETMPVISEGGSVYFANSYRITSAPPDWQAAYCDYGGSFVAALRRGGILACQFHPELSGAFGRRILANWLEGDSSC